MRTKACDDYISNRSWFRDVVGDLPIVLRGISAMEFLEYIDGYFGEETIFVYSKFKGVYENIDYFAVDDFENIEFSRQGNVLCSTFNQALNDMLGDSSVDDDTICEALCNYFYSNSESFDGLKILSHNICRFEYLKNSAVMYYSGG